MKIAEEARGDARDMPVPSDGAETVVIDSDDDMLDATAAKTNLVQQPSRSNAGGAGVSRSTAPATRSTGIAGSPSSWPEPAGVLRRSSACRHSCLRPVDRRQFCLGAECEPEREKEEVAGRVEEGRVREVREDLGESAMEHVGSSLLKLDA